jgi:YfiH family protein
MDKAEFEVRTDGAWSYFALPSLTNAGIVHGFMTRSSDSIVSNPEARESFLRIRGATDMIIMDQEHGSTVHVVAKGERPVAGDGLLMVEKGVIGVIKTADCLPVILYAAGYPVAAVVHAGWRGTVKGITGKALRLLIDMGIERERIGALIGPGIGPCCYEVKEDVTSAFREAGFGDSIFEDRGASTYLDLKKANRESIEREGIREIHDTGLCTACTPDLFHSARRDKPSGRQISFVLLPR